jgi:hypothetical protein
VVVPIKGLTDRVPSFPQIGTIRKGGPKKTEKRGKRTVVTGIGPDLKHFRVEFMEGEEEAEARFIDLYGEEPRAITVMLPFNEIERCWEAWREAYVSGALLHRCDGELIEYAISRETGEILARGGVWAENGEPAYCDGKPVAHYENSRGQQIPVYCKPRGRLRIIVPELRRAAYLLLLTGSINDIISISGQLEGIKELNAGQLRGIPLVLRRRSRRISTPGQNGRRVRREKSLVSIEADPVWVAAKVAQLKADALPELAMLDDGNEDGELEEELAVEGEVVAVEDRPNELMDMETDFYWHVAEQVLVGDPPQRYFNHPEHVKNALGKLDTPPARLMRRRRLRVARLR